MLTAIIHTEGDEAQLAYTLASLVPGVTEGLVKSAFVFGDTGSPHVQMLVEAAGCDSFDGTNKGFGSCINKTKTPWALMIRAGGELQQGWLGETSRFLSNAQMADKGQGAPIACFKPDQKTLADNLLASLIGRPSPRQGLICKTQHLKSWWDGRETLSVFPPRLHALPSSLFIRPQVLDAKIAHQY